MLAQVGVDHSSPSKVERRDARGGISQAPARGRVWRVRGRGVAAETTAGPLSPSPLFPVRSQAIKVTGSHLGTAVGLGGRLCGHKAALRCGRPVATIAPSAGAPSAGQCWRRVGAAAAAAAGERHARLRGGEHVTAGAAPCWQV